MGFGESALIETPSGQNILIDGGYPNQGTNTVIPLLLSKGIKRIDKMIVSNNDQDHYCGLVEILQDTRFKIGAFYHSGPFANLPNSNCLTSDRRLSSTLTNSISNGQMEQTVELSTNTPVTTLDFGNSLKVDLLKAAFSGVGDSNTNSNIIKITFNQISFLFTGDADDSALTFVMTNRPSILPSTIMKVPHHGSEDRPTPSATNSFLSIVKPQVAVLSVAGTSFGLPSPNTLKVYSDKGIRVMRTDKNGNIAFTTDGITYSIEPSASDSTAAGLNTISNVHVYPNPINETKGTIAYTLNDKADSVKAKIFTVSGELVQVLDGLTNSGNNFIIWDGKNQDGESVASGLYIILIEAKIGSSSLFGKSRFAVIKK